MISNLNHQGTRTPSSREVKVIFFDAAGTLFRVRGSVGEIYAGAARQFGVVADPVRLQQSFVCAFRTASARGLPKDRGLDQEHAERLWWMSVVQDAFGTDMPARILPEYFEVVFELFRRAEAWQLYPDCRETLRKLRGYGYRLGVISNFDSRLHDLLANLEIESQFEQVIISWRVGAAKPDPAIFRAALRAMGSAPRQSLHVGDSAAEDVEGALNVGMHAILLDRPGGQRVPNGAVSIRELSELRTLLTNQFIRR